MDRPARWPPACILVWPGQSTITLLPKLPTAVTMAPPRPSPNASNNTTEMTPQAIPSMVNVERMRFLSSAIQLCSISSRRYMLHLGSFVPETFGRFHVSSALRWIHSSVNSDEGQGQERSNDCDRRNHGLGDKVRQWSGVQQCAQTDSDEVPDQPAEDRQSGGLAEKLLKDVALSGAECLENADFACAFGDSHQHDVHHADSAKRQRCDRHATEEESNDAEDPCQDLGKLHGVPDEESVFVGRLEVVSPA